MAGYTGDTSAPDLLRLRRMVAEPAETTYTDEMLVDAIERYPLPDAEGYGPDDDYWTPVYDLAMAASEIWSEKAGAVAAHFDFQADGASFSKSQQVTHYERQARRWRAYRVPGSYTVEAAESSSGIPSYLGSINDPYE